MNEIESKYMEFLRSLSAYKRLDKVKKIEIT